MSKEQNTENKDKALRISDVIAMLPTEEEIDEWFTRGSENPPYTNIKTIRAIEGAKKYRAIMMQRLDKLKSN